MQTRKNFRLNLKFGKKPNFQKKKMIRTYKNFVSEKFSHQQFSQRKLFEQGNITKPQSNNRRTFFLTSNKKDFEQQVSQLAIVTGNFPAIASGCRRTDRNQSMRKVGSPLFIPFKERWSRLRIERKRWDWV